MDKKRVPSVSELLSRYKDHAPIARWERKLWLEGIDPEEEKKKAAGAGSICHDAIEAKVLGKEWAWPEGEGVDPIQVSLSQTGYEAFLDWWNPSQVEILGTETPLVSETFRFGGTPDAWGYVGGKISLLDWKTSNDLYSDYVSQLAAYAQLLRECKGIEVERIHLVRVGKKMADFHHASYPVGVIQLGWNTFEARLRCWDADKALESVVRTGR